MIFSRLTPPLPFPLPPCVLMSPSLILCRATRVVRVAKSLSTLMAVGAPMEAVPSRARIGARWIAAVLMQHVGSPSRSSRRACANECSYKSRTPSASQNPSPSTWTLTEPRRISIPIFWPSSRLTLTFVLVRSFRPCSSIDQSTKQPLATVTLVVPSFLGNNQRPSISQSYQPFSPVLSVYLLLLPPFLSNGCFLLQHTLYLSFIISVPVTVFYCCCTINPP